ncbi:hypothetical protein SNEBB_010682 [Seison nebaliae]|nr:hypothetical protein SNEBB_010682 [Seison nebaliae]
MIHNELSISAKICSIMFGTILTVIGTMLPLLNIIRSEAKLDNIVTVYFTILHLLSISWFIFIYIDTNIIKDNRTGKNGCLWFMKILDKCRKKRHYEENNCEVQSRTLERNSNTVDYFYDHTHPVAAAYIRFGCGVFALAGSILLSVMILEDFSSSNFAQCTPWSLIICNCTGVAFIVIQYSFVFQKSCMYIHRWQRLAMFGVATVVSTNFCRWSKNLVEETYQEMMHNNKSESVVHEAWPFLEDMGYHYHLNEWNCTESGSLSKIRREAAPYLFPASVEFSLLCIAIFFVMYMNIGKTPIDLTRTNENYVKRLFVFIIDCHKATRGMILGVLLLLLTFISLIIFQVYTHTSIDFLSADTEIAFLLSSITQIILLTIGFCTVIISSIKIRKLPRIDIEHPRIRFHADAHFVDEVLLILSILGIYAYDSFSFMAAIGSNDYSITIRIFLISFTLMSSLQATAQNIFLLDAHTRTISNEQHAIKPTREEITFILFNNIALWIFGSFANQRLKSNPIQQSYFGLFSWSMIAHIAVPLALFYRFHSSCLLADIWQTSYVIE